MMRTVRLLAAIAPAAALLLAPATVAAPYVPKDDATVLERLPLKPTDPLGRELRELRARLAAQPDDLDAAVTIGRHYFRLAMSEGDPRFIGYAEVALRPWARSKELPRNVLVLRALLRKYRHDFAGALDDLAAAAASSRSDAEVWPWRAAILLVQADYVGALSACDPLRARGESLDWIGCKSSVEGVTGAAERAYASLSEGLARERGVRAGPRLWMLSRLAEFSLVLGETDRAERHFKEALSLGVSDQFLLAAYADFLLDRGRPQEVVTLLKDWTRSDPLLLRLALAKENWTLQREPRDARILLEAALAANDPKAAQPALYWLARTGYQDPYLRRLAARLENSRP